MSEILEWHDANEEKPDVDTTVLCWDSEGYFCGYWDDSIPGWIACESGGSVTGVTHWSSPEGPDEGQPIDSDLELLDIPPALRRQAD